MIDINDKILWSTVISSLPLLDVDIPVDVVRKNRTSVIITHTHTPRHTHTYSTECTSPDGLILWLCNNRYNCQTLLSTHSVTHSMTEEVIWISLIRWFHEVHTPRWQRLVLVIWWQQRALQAANSTQNQQTRQSSRSHGLLPHSPLTWKWRQKHLYHVT